VARSEASSTIAREAYFLDFAASIHPRVKVPLALTGGFRTRSSMEKALESGEVDVIGIGRPLCYDPDYCNQLLSGQIDRISSPAETFSFKAEEAKDMDEIELRWAEVAVAGAYHFNQIRRLASGQETEREIQWQEQLERNKTLEAEAHARYRAAYLNKRKKA
jgi:tRNA-dihydrouridine synthase